MTRLLLVDDEPGLRMTLAANLELEGFEVIEAESAEKALALAESDGRFDVVLTDVRMPGMTGVELFRKLKPLRPGLPVILMTAFALEELVRSALDDGAYTVLSKPFDLVHAARLLERASKGPKVLIVDDCREEADAMADMAKQAGMSVVVAYNAPDAVAAVTGGVVVDVAVLDMVMPETTGAQLLDEIQRANRDVAFIGVSGQATEETMRTFANSGTSWFMRKPFAPNDLVRLIAKVRGTPAAKRLA